MGNKSIYLSEIHAEIEDATAWDEEPEPNELAKHNAHNIVARLDYDWGEGIMWAEEYDGDVGGVEISSTMLNNLWLGIVCYNNGKVSFYPGKASKTGGITDESKHIIIDTIEDREAYEELLSSINTHLKAMLA